MTVNTEKLVNKQQLLEALFTEDCRPSVRTLNRMMKRRRIPYIKISGNVFFDVNDVRQHLLKKNLIRAC